MRDFEPAGLGRPCESCGKPMLASLSGRGYCLRCAPAGDVPLVPVSSEKTFFRAKAVYERALRDLAKDRRERVRHLAPGSGPGSLRVVTRPRRPADPDHPRAEFDVPKKRKMKRSPGEDGRPRRLGRPRMLSDADVESLRQKFEQGQTYTWDKFGLNVAALAEEFKVHPRTMRRHLKRLGLKPKKRRRPKLKK